LISGFEEESPVLLVHALGAEILTFLLRTFETRASTAGER